MSSEENRPYKRRLKNFFIDKELQSTAIRAGITIIVLTSAVLGFFLLKNLIESNTVITTFENSRLIVKNSFEYVRPILVNIALITIVVGGGITALAIIFFTHRFAGPLYNIRNSIKRFRGGDLAHRIHLRRTDELTEVADEINQMIEALEAKIQTVKALQENHEVSLQNSNNEKLTQLNSELKELLNFFQLTDKD